MVNRESSRLVGSLEQVFGDGTVAGLSDAQLLERYAVRGDSTAFEALVSRYGPLVLGVCRRRLRDGHQAEDAFQATFLVLIRKARSIRVDQSIGPWIHGVAWRVAERQRVESARRRDRESTRDSVEDLASTDSEPRRLELAEVLDRELSRLPEKYRVPVILCDLEGLTHAEAAQRLGCPTGTVSIRLMRAHARLKDRLNRQGATPAASLLIQALSAGDLARPVVPAGLFDSALRASIGKAGFSPLVAELTQGVLRDMIRTKIQQTLAIGLISIGLVASMTTLTLAYLRQAPRPEKIIKGQVVDDRGRPVPGAEIWMPIFRDLEHSELHAVTDAEGRFLIPVDEALVKDEQALSMATLWSFKPGRSIGLGSPYKLLKGIDPAEIVIRLGPATDTAFTVIGPDNRPVVGATVNPYHVQAPNTAYTFPPKAMLPAIGGVTDDQGRVRLPALNRQGFSAVQVTSKAFGEQSLRLTDKANEPAERTVHLRPVGKVEGRIVADRPEVASGVELYFTTDEELYDGGWKTEGHAHVVTDEQGKFSVEALASGHLRIDGDIPKSKPFRLRQPAQFQVHAGDISHLDLPADPAVKVRGIIRSSESKTPLAGAIISVGYGTFRQSDQITTGLDGKFEAFVLPGNVRLHVILTPEGYVQLGAPWAEPVVVPADQGDFDLPPVELVKTIAPVAGRLVDSRDRPIGLVQIIAVSNNRRYGFARTDAAGAFTLDGLPPNIDFSYEAWSEDEVSVPTEVVHAKPLLLRARFKREMIEKAGGNASISARVVDRDGKAVADAELVLVETSDVGRGARKWDRFGKTDAEGWCRKPVGLEKGTTYHVIVKPGTVGVRASEEIRSDGAGPIEFAPIVVDRFREITGSIVDDQGKPISGATVLNRGNAAPLTSSSTDADGKFRLGGIPSGEAFLFADASGYRFQGTRVEPQNDGPTRLVLTRRDAPRPTTPALVDPPIPRQILADLALKLVTPDIEPILAGKDTNAQTELFEILARIDPQGAWAKVRSAEKPWDRDAARIAVFHAFLKSDPTTAGAILLTIKHPYYRLESWERLFDQTPADQVARRREILAGALTDARRPESDRWKVGFLAHNARRLTDLGEPDAARAIVNEVLAPAKALDDGIGRPGSMGDLADVLGRIDPAAAEAMIPKDAAERAKNDMRGAVAEGSAVLDPARAERLIGQFTHDSSEVYAVHTCRRMAGVDLPRARRLASLIKSDALRGYAYALMADTLAKADPVVANGLLDASSKAFADALARGQGGVWSSHSAAVMAASLLPVVARVCPDRLDEFAWRAVSLRWLPRSFNDLTMTMPDTSPIESMNQSGALALLLARYDRELARKVLTPTVDGFLAKPAGSEISWLRWRLILSALTQVDPILATEIASVIPDLKESDGRSIRQEARLKIARGLLESPEEIFEDARREIIDLEILLRENR